MKEKKYRLLRFVRSVGMRKKVRRILYRYLKNPREEKNFFRCCQRNENTLVWEKGTLSQNGEGGERRSMKHFDAARDQSERLSWPSWNGIRKSPNNPKAGTTIQCFPVKIKANEKTKFCIVDFFHEGKE